MTDSTRQQLDYATNPRGDLRRLAPLGIVLLVLVPTLGVSAIVLSTRSRVGCTLPNRMTCASNLRQIGQGIQMYANDNHGQFPPDLATVLLTQELTSEVFVCYRTSDTRATGPTTRAVAANLEAGGHLSYVYCGRGMDMNAPATAVLAYERPGNHGDGMHVLFGDGHVEFLDAKRGRLLLAELVAGHNPPRALDQARSAGR